MVHVAAALLTGAAAGVEVDVVPYLARRYFGVEVFGRAYLALAAIFGGGAGLSPFLVSLWFDATGSYLGFLGASIVMGLLAAAMLRLLGPYPSAPPGERDTPQMRSNRPRYARCRSGSAGDPGVSRAQAGSTRAYRPVRAEPPGPALRPPLERSRRRHLRDMPR